MMFWKYVFHVAIKVRAKVMRQVEKDQAARQELGRVKRIGKKFGELSGKEEKKWGERRQESNQNWKYEGSEASRTSNLVMIWSDP